MMFTKLLPLLCLMLLAGTALGETRLGAAPAQGALVFGRTAPGATILLDDREVRADARGRFVLGFGRDAAPSARLSIQHPDGSLEVQRLRVAPRQYAIQRIDGIEKKFMDLDAATLERVRAEQRQASEARSVQSDLSHAFEDFTWPVKGPVTGVYGSQRIFNGQPRRPHYGIDIAAARGTPVLAPAGGRVTLAHPDMFFSGGTLILDHGRGVFSSFLHLSEIGVQVGQMVARGEEIGRVGATGRVTGAHLDWRLNWFDRHLDPARLLPPMTP